MAPGGLLSLDEPPEASGFYPVRPALVPDCTGWTHVACLGPYPGCLASDIDVDHSILSEPPKGGACDKPFAKGTLLTGLATGLTFSFCKCEHNCAHALVKRHLAPIPSTSYEDETLLPGLLAAAERVGTAARESYRARREHSRAEWMARWPKQKRDAFIADEAVNPSTQAVLHEKGDDGTTWTRGETLSQVEQALAGGFPMEKFETDVLPGQDHGFGTHEKASKNPVHALKGMIKTEPNILSKNKFPDKPRIIQFYKFLSEQSRFGPHHYALQKSLCDIAGGDDPRGFEVCPGVRVCIASAMNQIAQGQWFDDATQWAGPKGFGIERDGVRWDSTLKRFAYKAQLKTMWAAGAECEFIRHVRDTHTCRATFGSGRSILKSGKRLRWQIRYTTKSGHNDTTWRNSLYNMLVSALSFHALGIQARIMVIGDDMIAFVREPFDKDALLSMERRYGIIPEMAVFSSDKFSRMEFASSVFMPCVVDGRPTFVAVPKLGKLYGKLFWTTTHVAQRQVGNFRASVAFGMKNLLSALPAYKEFLSANLVGGDVTFNTRRWFSDVERPVAYDPFLVNLFFLDRYGISPDGMKDVSDTFTANRGRIGIVKHDLADLIVGFDTADPIMRASDDFLWLRPMGARSKLGTVSLAPADLV